MKFATTLLLLIWPSILFAQQANPVTVAAWKVGKDGPELTIALGSLMTKKQRQMIEGGFTTFSDLTIYPTGATGKPVRDSIANQIRCSVKYDAWEEIFDVVQLGDVPRTGIVKSFGDYASRCLTTSLSKHTMDQGSLRIGSDLIAELSVIQTSIDEEQKIKEWLVSQQSGVMQTLFSHMLGELSLQQKLVVRIAIPAIPESIGKTDKGKGKG